MENVLSLTVSEQNRISKNIIGQIICDSRQLAEESEESVADYLVRDFEASPEGWDCLFEYAYDEISSLAKKERREIIVNLLVQEGEIISEEN